MHASVFSPAVSPLQMSLLIGMMVAKHRHANKAICTNRVHVCRNLNSAHMESCIVTHFPLTSWQLCAVGYRSISVAMYLACGIFYCVSACCMSHYSCSMSRYKAKCDFFGSEPLSYNRNNGPYHIYKCTALLCAHVCVLLTYLCCLCGPLAVAEHWALDTLLLPLCHGRGRLGKCGCAGSGSSSCVCCWWPHCPRGLTGEPAAHHWRGYPGPGGGGFICRGFIWRQVIYTYIY